MRVLVTGHKGYFGAVLASVLHHARHEVVGLDTELYEGCDFGRVSESIPSYDMDLREVEAADLLSFDAVIHLAALPENLPRELPAHVLDEVNTAGTIRLAEMCKEAQVGLFLFASSCAVYGRSGNELVNESARPRPDTSYAQSKLECEAELVRLCDTRFAAVSLRNPTLYGVSPRLRLDTVVNEFVGAAVTAGRVEMKTAGRAWRPFLHVEDLARAYAAVLLAPVDEISGQVFNVVSSQENHRVIDVADTVVEHVSGCTRAVRTDVLDQRSYRVDGAKFARTFPAFEFRWTLESGIRQLREAMTAAGLTRGEWRSDRFRRSARLATLLQRGDVDSELRREAAEEACAVS